MLVILSMSVFANVDSCLCPTKATIDNPRVVKKFNRPVQAGKSVAPNTSTTISGSFNTTINHYYAPLAPGPIEDLRPSTSPSPVPVPYVQSPFIPDWLALLIGWALLGLLVAAIWSLFKNSSRSDTPPMQQPSNFVDTTSKTSVTETKERNAKELIESLTQTGGDLKWSADGDLDIHIPSTTKDVSKELAKVLENAASAGSTVTVNADGSFKVEHPHFVEKKS